MQRLTGVPVVMLNMMRLPWLVLVTTAMLSAFLLAILSCGSSDFPIGRKGSVLTINVVDLERLAELRYSNTSEGRVINHFRVTPTLERWELVLLRVQMGNNTAVTAMVTVDEQAARLRDFFDGIYTVLDIASVGETWVKSDADWVWVNNLVATKAPNFGEGEEVPDPPDWGKGPVRLIELQEKKQALPGQGFLTGLYRLQKGYSVDGWMVFQAPEGTKFSELSWKAGDSVTIPF